MERRSPDRRQADRERQHHAAGRRLESLLSMGYAVFFVGAGAEAGKPPFHGAATKQRDNGSRR